MSNLKKLFSKIPNISLDQISDVTTNLQKATENSLVFYNLHDGEKALVALKKRLEGVKPGLLLLSAQVNEDLGVNFISLDKKDFYDLQKDACDFVYPKGKDTKIIGITGTNGKSTVCHLVAEILRSNGYKAASIGTVGVMEGEKEIFPSPDATTPSFIELRKILHHLSEYEYIALEVSSHALAQHRLGEIKLESIGWTNFSQDHLDYHNTMEEYFWAKTLIRNYSSKKIIVSKEKDLMEELSKIDVPFATAHDVEVGDIGDSFKLEYNLKNLSLAKALCECALGSKVKLSEKITLPKGRFNSFRLNKSVFVVDYAHTPDAIENLVSETKKAFSSFNVVTVFGCGGDRDRLKRPKMLEAALKYSDKVVVTTDNPRTEDPKQIVEDIIKNNDNSKVEVIVDRKEAIENVVQDYESDTIVLIAGKGHEEYQDVMGKKLFFSDIEEVKSCIEKLK